MRGPFLVLVALLLAHAGCVGTPEAERVTPGEPSAGDGQGGTATGQTAAPILVDEENADLRIRLASHEVDDASTRIVLQVVNKRADDVLLRYANLNTTGGEFYFQLDARIPAGEERTVAAEDASGDRDDRRAPWTEISFYYTNAHGTPEASDGAASLDLRGRGLPS